MKISTLHGVGFQRHPYAACSIVRRMSAVTLGQQKFQVFKDFKTASIISHCDCETIPNPHLSAKHIRSSSWRESFAANLVTTANDRNALCLQWWTLKYFLSSALSKILFTDLVQGHDLVFHLVAMVLHWVIFKECWNRPFKKKKKPQFYTLNIQFIQIC